MLLIIYTQGQTDRRLYGGGVLPPALDKSAKSAIWN